MAKAKKISRVTGKLNPGTRKRRSRVAGLFESGATGRVFETSDRYICEAIEGFEPVIELPA